MVNAVETRKSDRNGASRWRAAMLGVPAAIALAANAGAAPLEASAEGYRHYLIEDIGQALNGTRALRERLVAADLDGAKRAWIEARVGWERSEVFTSGFVPELDQQIDAWPNATEGFHGIEVRLFGANRTDVGDETDALIAHLADLRGQIENIPLAPQRLLNGVARLAFEVGGNKADGGEVAAERDVAQRHAEQRRRHRAGVSGHLLRFD